MSLTINKTLKIWFNLNEKLRYLVVGGFNTAFSYGLFCGFQFFLGEKIHYLFILALTHFISVFNSFFNFRFFVFRSNGNFWYEYLKINIVYLFYFFINAFLLYIIKDKMHIGILIAQLICTAILIIATYFTHKYFSFKNHGKKIG